MKEISQVAEITLSYNPETFNNPKIKTASDAFAELKMLFDPRTISLQEQFVVVYVNKGNRIIGMYRLSTGGITGTVADIRLILAVALKTAATAILLAHNHPSGNLKPSQQDIAITTKIKAAAALMDIDVLDHLIISPEMKFTSMAEEGLL